MNDQTPSPSDVKIHRLRFVAFGVAFLLLATMVGGTLIGFKTINQLNTIQSNWLEFRHITANKGQALSQIRNYFGFGGFIHNFQNYVSVRNPDMAGVVRRDMDELLAAVATYEIIGISRGERAAFADIRKPIANYRSNLDKAEQMIAKDGDPGDIARLMTVDNRHAFAALVDARGALARGHGFSVQAVNDRCHRWRTLDQNVRRVRPHPGADSDRAALVHAAIGPGHGGNGEGRQ